MLFVQPFFNIVKHSGIRQPNPFPFWELIPDMLKMLNSLQGSKAFLYSFPYYTS